MSNTYAISAIKNPLQELSDYINSVVEGIPKIEDTAKKIFYAPTDAIDYVSAKAKEFVSSQYQNVKSAYLAQRQSAIYNRVNTIYEKYGIDSTASDAGRQLYSKLKEVFQEDAQVEESSIKDRFLQKVSNFGESVKSAVSHPIEHFKEHNPVTAYRFNDKKIRQVENAYKTAMRIDEQFMYSPTSLSKLSDKKLESYLGEIISKNTSSYHAYSTACKLVSNAIVSNVKDNNRIDVLGVTVYKDIAKNLTTFTDEGQKAIGYATTLAFAGLGIGTALSAGAGHLSAVSNYALSRANMSAISKAVKHTTDILTDNALVQGELLA